MKSRSHPLPAYDPPEDWVNGSWTVDCVCGVNFDDGEEMVNCDECGVWVHTRCSRFVKGDKSFACDKCKSKNSRNDSEETEVAQLLVELPTKTMKMNHNPNKNNCSSYPLNKNPPPARRPCGLWTDRPIEERVHVQGVPGGDPSLFQGLSSLFTAQLWKCSGYVPKKFNFCYREFLCWDEEKQLAKKVVEDGDTMADKGAGVLYSLSNEAVAGAPVSVLEGMKNQSKPDFHAGMDEKSSIARKLEMGDTNSRVVQGTVKAERSLLRSILIQSGKRKREDVGATKERGVRKKNREFDVKKSRTHVTRTAVQPPHLCIQKHAGYLEGKGPSDQIAEVKHETDGNTLLPEVASDTIQADGSNSDKPRSRDATLESTLEPLSPKMSGHEHLNNSVKTEKDENSCSMRVDPYPLSGGSPLSMAVQDDAGSGSILAVKEAMDLNDLKNELQDYAANPVNDLRKSNSPVRDEGSAASEFKYGDVPKEAGSEVYTNSLAPNRKSAPETADDYKEGIVQSSCCIDVIMENTHVLAQSQVLSDDRISDKIQLSDKSDVNDAVPNSSYYGEHKANKGLEAVSGLFVDKKPGDAPQTVTQLKQEQKVPLEHDIKEKMMSLESTQACKDVEDRSKFNAAVIKPPATNSQHKIVPAGKSYLSSSNIIISRSPADQFINTNTQPHKQMVEQALSNSVVYTKKDKVICDLVNKEDAKKEEKHEMHGMRGKQRLKSSVNDPPSNASRSGRNMDGLVSKHISLRTKDAEKSRAMSVECSAASSASGESFGGTLQYQKGISHGQNKINTSTSQTSGEKNIQSSSKSNHSSLGNPVASLNPPAGLSDEELALLLHQELNSSPRVPRIPRMRNAGSSPQLPSASVASILAKKTSISGGKDQYTLLRRKGKDGHKDGSRSSHELDKDRRVDGVPSSPDSTKTVNEEPQRYSRKFSARIVTAGPPLSLGEAKERKVASEENSPLNNSEGDASTKGPANRTLPGLIAEIMSKGERMTYDELCNAVFPHWHSLRKHNGERYAYTSHSQAVLDCLRNRVEWARLVDRGPKTNANRKRRKIDAEASNVESEDNGCGEDGFGGRGSSSKRSVDTSSSREDFPKGKRNARKRRRLALHGRGVRDLRKRRKTKVVSDDDDDDDETASSSPSPSEESSFSEDESNGGGPAGSEDSAATSYDDRAAV